MVYGVWHARWQVQTRYFVMLPDWVIVVIGDLSFHDVMSHDT